MKFARMVRLLVRLKVKVRFVERTLLPSVQLVKVKPVFAVAVTEIVVVIMYCPIPLPEILPPLVGLVRHQSIQ